MERDEEELPDSERARDRRRDHDAEARARSGMRTGLAKQFKQVLDAQRKRAEEAGRRLPKTAQGKASEEETPEHEPTRHRPR